MDKNIKLSALIRIGSKLTRQAFGQIEEDGNTCAIGAAIHAKTGELPFKNSNNIDIYNILPELKTPINSKWNVRDFIVNLNDNLKLTREKIADQLEARGL